MANKDKIWVWGISQKKRPAIQEVFRVVKLDPQARIAMTLPSKLDELAVERLPRRRLGFSGSHEVLQFGGRDLATMTGGLVIRAREHGGPFSEIVFEDHGIGPGDPAMPNDPDETLLFFGGDAVTLRTLPMFRRSFERLREALAPGARVVLMHCWAFSDGGRLALAISRILGHPVVGMNGYQTVDNQQIEGPIFQAYNGHVTRRASMSKWIVNFD